MSQESFNAFKAKLAATETLREELSRVVGANGTVDDLVAFARAHGYEFDSADIRQDLELSDADLEAVAGGTAKRPGLMQACANGEHIKEGTITV